MNNTCDKLNIYAIIHFNYVVVFIKETNTKHMKTYQNTIYLEVVCTNLYQLVGSQCSRREVKQLCWDFMPQQR